MNILLIGFSAIIGAFVQTVAGFGAGIAVMMILPYFYSLSEASAINSSMTIILNLIIIIQFRKHINWKKLIPPAIITLLFTTISIRFFNILPIKIIKIIFAIFIGALAIYFLVFKDVKLKDNIWTLLLCGMLAGFGNGLFGIGGPPLVIYMLAVCDSKEEYLASLQTIFFVTGLYSASLKWINGYANVSLLLPIIFGMVMMIVGERIGLRYLNKISAEKMKLYIYILMMITAIVQLIQCF